MVQGCPVVVQRVSVPLTGGRGEGTQLSSALQALTPWLSSTCLKQGHLFLQKDHVWVLTKEPEACPCLDHPQKAAFLIHVETCSLLAASQTPGLGQ